MKPARPFPARDTVHQAVANTFTLTRCVRLLYERTLLLLISMFCIGAGCMLWYVLHLQSNLIAAMALQDAALYAPVMAEVRTLYTSEVVEIVRQQGIEVTHDYATRFALEPLIDGCLHTVEPLVKSNRPQLVKDLAVGLPALCTDQDKLQQILMNLLSNAVKFTPAGAVTVMATHGAENKHGQTILYTSAEIIDRERGGVTCVL
jgi:signal transduction histidine kinase